MQMAESNGQSEHALYALLTVQALLFGPPTRQYCMAAAH